MVSAIINKNANVAITKRAFPPKHFNRETQCENNNSNYSFRCCMSIFLIYFVTLTKLSIKRTLKNSVSRIPKTSSNLDANVKVPRKRTCQIHEYSTNLHKKIMNNNSKTIVHDHIFPKSVSFNSPPPKPNFRFSVNSPKNQ